MNLLFSAYMSNGKDLNKLSNEVLIESKKVAKQIVSDIKSGFVFLVDSISNSYSFLQKTFSFAKQNKQDSTQENQFSYPRPASIIIIENKIDGNEIDSSSISSRQFEFNNLKADMHSKLNLCFNQK